MIKELDSLSLEFIRRFLNNEEEVIFVAKDILKDKMRENRDLEIFKFLNFEKYISKEELDDFLKSKILSEVQVLMILLILQ